MKTVKSVCHLCHGGCGALLKLEAGRVTDISPDPDSPYSKGYMCSKGMETASMMYHPDRILQPMKRTGPRGSGNWQEMDWDDILDEIACRIKTQVAEYGAPSIVVGQGTARHHYCHVRRFANALGTPNWYEPGLSNCFIPRVTASIFTYGALMVPDYFGKEIPRTILVWGCNSLVSNPDGKLAFRLRNMLQQGSYGINIDPRRNETGRLCREWLAIRPGTDAALALAMIHIIIREEWYDKDFIAAWTSGFDELKQHVQPYTPAWAADITGLPEEQITTVAKRYATEKPAVIDWGVALDQNINSFQTARAICILRSITGNIDNPGGEVMGNRLLRDYPLLEKHLKRSTLDKRLGAEAFKLLGGHNAVIGAAHIPAIFKAILTSDPYPVRAMLIFGNNPVMTVAGAAQVSEALQRLDLLVVTDMFMTPTARLADYFLPASFWPEIDHVTELPAFAPKAVMIQKKCVQTGDCRSDEEIIDQLSRLLDLPGSATSFREIIDYQLEPLGKTFAEMQDIVTLDTDYRYYKYRETAFNTRSKKVALYSEALMKMGYSPLPVYKEPPESPLSTPALLSSYPLILTTGIRRKEFFHSEQRQIPTLRKRKPHPVAEIHPRTAAQRDITDGDWIWVESPRGKIKVQALVTPDIREDIVAVEHGWWLPESADDGGKALLHNANVLTAAGPPYDEAFGSYQLRGLLCQVSKAGDLTGKSTN